MRFQSSDRHVTTEENLSSLTSRTQPSLDYARLLREGVRQIPESAHSESQGLPQRPKRRKRPPTSNIDASPASRLRITSQGEPEADQVTESHGPHQETDEGKRKCERSRHYSLETLNVQAESYIRTARRGFEKITKVPPGASEKASIVRPEKSGTSRKTERPFRTHAPEETRQSCKKTKLEDYKRTPASKGRSLQGGGT